MHLAPIPRGGIVTECPLQLGDALFEGFAEDILACFPYIRGSLIIPPGAAIVQLTHNFVPARSAIRIIPFLGHIVVERVLQEVTPEGIEHRRG